MFNVFLYLVAFCYDRSIFRLAKDDLAANKSKYNRESTYPAQRVSVLFSLINPSFAVVFSYRVYSGMYKSERYLVRKLSIIIYYFSCRRYSCDIHPEAEIGVPFKIGHCSDIVVGPMAVVGSNCYFFNGITIGNKYVGEKDEMPKVGNNVIIGTGSKILGRVSVGSNSIVGASTLVINSIPSGCTIVGVPGRVISSEDNGQWR